MTQEHPTPEQATALHDAGITQPPMPSPLDFYRERLHLLAHPPRPMDGCPQCAEEQDRYQHLVTTAAPARQHVFGRNTQAAADLGALFDSPLTWPRIDGRNDFDAACVEVARKLVGGEAAAFRYGCLTSFHVVMHLADPAVPLGDVLITAGWSLPRPAASRREDSSAPGGGAALRPLVGCHWEATGRALDLRDDDAKAITYLITAIGCAIEEITRKPTIPEVLPRLRDYYAQPGNEAGGSLHIVLEDGNVADDYVRFCIEEAGRRDDVDGVALARLLLRMNKTQRRKLGALVHER